MGLGILPHVRLVLPAQPVDATPSNALIRQCFPGRSDLFGCPRSKPSQGSVPADLTLASDLAFVFNASQVRLECCVDPLDHPANRKLTNYLRGWQPVPIMAPCYTVRFRWAQNQTRAKARRKVPGRCKWSRTPICRRVTAASPFLDSKAAARRRKLLPCSAEI